MRSVFSLQFSVLSLVAASLLVLVLATGCAGLNQLDGGKYPYRWQRTQPLEAP